MTLREKRVLFSKLLCDLIMWIGTQPGWEAAFDEVAVHSPRAGRLAGQKVTVDDAVHKLGSFHHQGLAADLLLYIDGKYILDGGHPAWTAIGLRWESMHPLCTWGGRFRDANHLSFGEGTKPTLPGATLQA